MAQKTEKEETDLKVVPETIVLCAKCGVAGNSSANKLCQNCFNKTSAVSASTTTPVVSPGGAKERNLLFGDESFRSTSSKRSSRVTDLNPAEVSRDLGKEAFLEPPSLVKREVNRCFGCRRKVGLAGFRCRCGELFCAIHRYSDRHDCSYDYKAAGRETIEKENPVVKAAKIVKI